MTIQYAIRRVSLLSAFRFGFVIGGTVLFLPGFLFGLVSVLVARWLQHWLQSWTGIRGLGIDLRLIDLLKLTGFLAWLNTVVDWGWLLIPLIALLVMVIGGVGYGLATMLSASTYNFLATLSGGLVVELEEVGKPTLSPQPINALPAPAANLPPTQLQAAPAGARAALHTSTGQSWPLSPAGATLGSAPGSTILLPGLLPRHAEIRFENNRYYVLYDLSRGQTWVDGRPVQQANLLKNGFQIRVGNYVLTFQQS